MMDALESELLDLKSLEHVYVLTGHQTILLRLASLDYLQQHGTRTASSVLTNQGKIIGYELTIIIHNSIFGVRVLPGKTSLAPLSDTFKLDFDDEKVDVIVSEINPSLCPCLSSTKHSKDTTLSSGTEDEDTQTINDDKAISSDEPHPRKADVDDFEIIIHQCLGRFAIFDPNAATNMPVHPLFLFPEIIEFEIQ
ncbi:hypothetical protein SADUNF_Sadunf19G0029200 [Salix dunnii]|uniref:Uncharacterized protein n=1 Tax=Salix dunnii TaxID=1413687 RepID=A0A835J0X2_9ROSI|nr:hypothetical protein SADUNF_Sadunf19G0002300 [Salix dunnii]KAF9661066.1 hypothetical protein SADUNF_Sadunf19G0029200 [Salix dunnii]